MILIVSNSRDVATDYVTAELRDKAAAFHRLDLDLLANDEVSLDLPVPVLHHFIEDRQCKISASELTAVFFRAPTHLRESSGHRYEPSELLQRHQWAAFARSLTVFNCARWINHPAATYAAESKALQLFEAHKCGLAVPRTSHSNFLPEWTGDQIAIKALDSFLLRIAEEDVFFYTQILRAEDALRAGLREMPVIVQQPFVEKLDVRVTVVGKQVFAAAIADSEGRGIRGDWRLRKDACEYSRIDLPLEIEEATRRFMGLLGLVYGALDFVVCDGQYLFLEVNPTGEWIWLERRLGFPISRAIANELSNHS